MPRRRRDDQSGQVLVIVAVWLVALIGSAALILLTGSVEWQRNQLQQIADQAALDAALKIGVGCSAGAATTVLTEADNFIATQRTRTGSLNISGSSCSAGYTGTDTFSTGVTATIHYPYRAQQQQVEVIITEALPISFGSYLGATNTNVTRRAVAQQLNASTAAVTATTLSCTGGQFNVAGSVVASNAIALSGGCAIYTHDRFDVTSGTYSDLGNTSVYAGGQAWVGGGGSCAAGSSSGSSNALCADGYQVSGHFAVSCGVGGTSAYLAAGDAAINPNPCAAGAGGQPVAPVSSLLTPEPNTDPAAIATLQGTGGAACTPGGAYPNIVIGGTTVGTGDTPAPLKDASGFYHFKPSCYGYLDLTSMMGGISNRQTGAESAFARHFIAASLPAASQAGTLLVATVNSDETPNKFGAPAGWISAAEADQVGEGRSEIWYYPNNPGGITTATFTMNPATVGGEAQITEWSGALTASPLDKSGSQAVAVPTSNTTISTAGALVQTGELVITNDGFKIAAGTFTRAAGWNGLVTDTTRGFGSEYRLDLPAAVASEALTTSVPSLWANVIAAFKPASASTGAVLDPGFYYFNGSGFAGGGGICLNGGQLLARDVTIEFVNSAGLSTGSCAVGGASTCSASTCSFGSDPCSVAACPPNSAADAAGGGYEWFAAPCNQAPAGDAGCSGSAWCPVGDRACWNLLVWAPSTVTGQIAIKGTVAEAWLLGSIYWPGTCAYTDNGGSMIEGNIACGALTVAESSISAAAVGSDYGVSTALVEAVLVE